MSVNIKENGSLKKISGSSSWTGTRAEYEAIKDTIPTGSVVNILDDQDIIVPISTTVGNTIELKSDGIYSPKQIESDLTVLNIGINHLYRGKNLGTINISNIDSFLEEHKVSTGEFKDIYLGDYITIQDGTFNKIWLVAGFDVYYKILGMESHHIVLIPKDDLGCRELTSTSTYVGGFKATTMFSYLRNTVDVQLTKALGDHLLVRECFVTNDNLYERITDGKSYLMTEIEVIGCMLFSISLHDNTGTCKKLPIFDFISYTDTDNPYWLRSRSALGGTGAWVVVSDMISACAANKSDLCAVRPVILVG